jgi:hypothetical protein
VRAAVVSRVARMRPARRRPLPLLAQLPQRRRPQRLRRRRRVLHPWSSLLAAATSKLYSRRHRR